MKIIPEWIKKKQTIKTQEYVATIYWSKYIVYGAL